MFRIIQCFALSLILFLQTSNCAVAQTTSLSVEEWAKKLSDQAGKENKWYSELTFELDKPRSSTVKEVNFYIAVQLKRSQFFIQRNKKCYLSY